MKDTERTQDTEKNEKVKAPTLILKDVVINPIVFDDDDKLYLITKLDEECAETLENNEYCETAVTDGRALLPVSRFAEAKNEDGAILSAKSMKIELSQHNLYRANIKLRLSDYDWKYKGMKGHTTRWEVIGARIFDVVGVRESPALEGLDE